MLSRSQRKTIQSSSGIQEEYNSSLGQAQIFDDFEKLCEENLDDQFQSEDIVINCVVSDDSIYAEEALNEKNKFSHSAALQSVETLSCVRKRIRVQ